MARPPKKSNVPYEIHKNINEYYLKFHKESNGMPSKKYHEQIIRALLQRLQGIDPEQAAHCAGMIAVIAGAEVARFASQDQIENEIKWAFNGIAFGKPSRAMCGRGTFLVQRDMLLDYLMREEYPCQAENTKTMKDWLAQHWSRIIELITPTPCGCSYTVSFDGLGSLAERSGTSHKWRSVADTAVLILANLHNTTPANIRRILKALP